MVPAIRAAPLPPAATDVPLIDRAEALLVELQAILLRLDGRHQTNVGTNLEILACAAELREDLVPAYLAEHPLMIGEGNRICDEMDRQEALEAEAEARIEALLANVPRLPRPLDWPSLETAIDSHLENMARIEADLVARHGEDGRRAFEIADDAVHARREWRRKERGAA